MKNRYGSLRNFVTLNRDNPDFNRRLCAIIYRWARDDELSLKEFAFLIKKALGYANK